MGMVARDRSNRYLRRNARWKKMVGLMTLRVHHHKHSDEDDDDVSGDASPPPPPPSAIERTADFEEDYSSDEADEDRYGGGRANMSLSSTDNFQGAHDLVTFLPSTFSHGLLFPSFSRFLRHALLSRFARGGGGGGGGGVGG